MNLNNEEVHSEGKQEDLSPTSSLPSPTTNIASTRNFELLLIQYVDAKNYFQVESKSLVNFKHFKVYRTYKDFQSLHDHLICFSELSTIIPPLPEPFVPEENKVCPTLAKTYNDCKIFFENAAKFAHYLNSVINHPALGSNENVEEFLTVKEFNPSEIEVPKSKQNFSLKSLTNMWKGNQRHKDCDDFYEKELCFTLQFGEKLKDVSQDFENQLVSNQKLCNVLAHLSTCIISTLVIHESQTQSIQLTKTFCTSLDLYKECLDANSYLAFQLLGTIFQYHITYNQAYKEMLSRRAELMVNYENANRNLQRSANTKNFDKASAEKNQAEQEFEQISEKGREEIKYYHKNREENLTKSINRFGMAQLALSKHTVALLRNCISSLKHIKE